VKTLPTLIMEKGLPRVKTPCGKSFLDSSILNQLGVQLEGKLGSFLRIETKGLERLQTVRAVNGSTYFQRDGVEANLACSSPQVLTKLTVLSIGGF